MDRRVFEREVQKNLWKREKADDTLIVDVEYSGNRLGELIIDKGATPSLHAWIHSNINKADFKSKETPKMGWSIAQKTSKESIGHMT